MPTPLQPELDDVARLLLDPDALLRAVAAGRRRASHPAWRRAEIRPVDLKAGRHLQIVTYDERQAHTTNHAYGPPAEAAVAALLAEPFGNWHVDTVDSTVELRVTKKGEAQVHRGPRATRATGAGRGSVASPDTVPGSALQRPHDRAKPRLLDAAHPVFRALGLADTHGRIKPSRQAKYRQVEDFLRQLDAVLPADHTVLGSGAATAGPLRVVDLGCGNAYLTFAAYAYLTDVLGREVELVGVDVREQARARNTELASRLGWSDYVRFVAEAIDTVELEVVPGVVLALHACDTATDDALVRAIGWKAPVILAAPCCHHDLQRRIAASVTPAPYGLVTRHGLLRERLADVLTDAFRAAVLRMVGYRVEVVEFVDSAHTPRNAMLRAVRTDAEPAAELARDYDALTREWGVTPYLADKLAALGVTIAARGESSASAHRLDAE